MHRVIRSVGALGIFAALGYALWWCFDPVNCPITLVRLVGQRQHVALAAIRENIAPEVGLGFFGLKVSKVKTQLMTLPWIEQVQVRKVWPRLLVITMQEQHPVLRWGGNGLVNRFGQVFYPAEGTATFKQLPQLKGPSGQEQLVWQFYLQSQKLVKKHNLEIQQLVLAPRGAWHLKLSNGMTVILGTNDPYMRLKQFVNAYSPFLQEQADKIAYADLRYTNGMAIGWRNAYANG